MDDLTTSELAQRLTSLEKESYWFKRAALVVLLIMIWSVITRPPNPLGNTAPHGRTLETEQLVIKDAQGKMRAILGSITFDGNTRATHGLFLYDESSNLKGYLTDSSLTVSSGKATANFDFTGLRFHGREKSLFYLDIEGPRLEMKGPIIGDKPRAEIEMDVSAYPQITLRDNNGKLRMKINALDDPNLTMLDQNGKTRMNLTTDARGPSLNLYDADGETLRATLGSVRLQTIRTGNMEQRAPSSLVLFDKEGKAMWMTPK